MTNHVVLLPEDYVIVKHVGEEGTDPVGHAVDGNQPAQEGCNLADGPGRTNVALESFVRSNIN